MNETLDENTSGGGFTAAVPAETDRWNWGAFLLSWIWGIGNNTFIALLALVPFVGIVIPFVLGAKGSAWAWRNKRWNSVAHFKETQHQWALWGVALWLAFIALFAAFVFGIMAIMEHSDVYKLARATAESNPQVVQRIGTPLATGFPSGSIRVSGPSGSADLSFSVSGPKGHGTLYVEARLEMGEWKIMRMVLEDDATGQRLELIPVPARSATTL